MKRGSLLDRSYGVGGRLPSINSEGGNLRHRCNNSHSYSTSMSQARSRPPELASSITKPLQYHINSPNKKCSSYLSTANPPTSKLLHNSTHYKATKTTYIKMNSLENLISPSYKPTEATDTRSLLKHASHNLKHER